MSKYYDEAVLSPGMKRDFDVYQRIEKLGIDLGTFDQHVVSLAGANIAGAVVHESGLVYLSGTAGGTLPMNEDPDRLQHGFEGAQHTADVLITTLHWDAELRRRGRSERHALHRQGAGHGRVARRRRGGGGAAGHQRLFPQMAVGLRRRDERPSPKTAWTREDSPAYTPGARWGGFDGKFSIEPEIIVAIPPALARDIIMNRGWVFPLPPDMLARVKASR